MEGRNVAPDASLLEGIFTTEDNRGTQGYFVES
jgi:hypothetical protein